MAGGSAEWSVMAQPTTAFLHMLFHPLPSYLGLVHLFPLEAQARNTYELASGPILLAKVSQRAALTEGAVEGDPLLDGGRGREL